MGRLAAACRCTILAALVALPVDAAPSPLVIERVRMRDVRGDGGVDLAKEISLAPVVVPLPFDVTWDGQRHGAVEVGAGWARLLVAGEVAGALPALPLALRGQERPPPRPGPRFVAWGDAALGPAARVIISTRSHSLVVRWWGLLVPEAAGTVAVELLIDGFGTARLQYLQVPDLPTGAGERFAGIEARGTWQPFPPDVLGVGPRSGLALEIAAPDPSLGLVLPAPDASGPPPAGCAAPPSTWCHAADGAGADTLIWMDARFEEPVIPWTPGGGWRLAPFSSCTPGATGPGGAAFQVADAASCSVLPGSSSTLTGPIFGPVGATAFLSFSTRAELDASDAAEVLVNGMPIGGLPPGLDPGTWYRIGPLAIPAGTAQVGFRFAAGASAVPRLGWMVDDVFVHEENGANWRCVHEALHADGQPPLADCDDTEHDDWAFDESDYCLDCTYTFYAVVDCGREMHLPLRDMEGAEVRVTEMVTGTAPGLTCSNDVFRTPASPPVLRRQDCCAMAGEEIWTGPAFSATDNRGAGRVAWGLPGCSSVLDAYDLDLDGLECAELDPPCGGTLARVSPGEEQVMDCVVTGDPALCGLYRIEITSGGFAWNLFANCSGGPERGFRLFTSCEDAWAAWTPLPEIALSSATSPCPAGPIEFTLENVGCADVTADIAVSAISNCPVPDFASWVVSGGLAANSRRTESRPFVTSCMSATVTLTVDPADLLVECSETPGAAACAAIAGVRTLDVIPTSPLPTGEASIRARRLPGNILRFDWAPVAGAASYRVARGPLGNYYSHSIDQGAGIGTCDTAGARLFDDSGVFSIAAAFYFVVAPISPCGSVGSFGLASDGTRRPPPLVTLPCP